MKITYYGHACFGVEIGDKSIIFDPFITPNEQAANIDISTIKANYVLLSHGHVDHIADAEAISQLNNATIVSNFEIVSWFQNKGLQNGHPMNHGGKWKFDFGTVKYVNAIHSSVLPDGAYGGNPGGFVVETEEGNFYFAGDTALTMDMKLIPETTKLDFCMLPIGDNFTMGVDDAVKAAEFVQCNKVFGMHYDTFPPIKIDLEAAKNSFQQANIELFLPSIGETKEM